MSDWSAAAVGEKLIGCSAERKKIFFFLSFLPLIPRARRLHLFTWGSTSTSTAILKRWICRCCQCANERNQLLRVKIVMVRWAPDCHRASEQLQCAVFGVGWEGLSLRLEHSSNKLGFRKVPQPSRARCQERHLATPCNQKLLLSAKRGLVHSAIHVCDYTLTCVRTYRVYLDGGIYPSLFLGLREM